MARRYFVDPLPAAGTTVLRADVAHHLAAVLRCRRGDEVVLCDGRGGECTAVVQQVQRGELTVELGPRRQAEPARLQVHLALAPPRWQRAEWLFEHGTEVGVAVFHPLYTERTRPQGERHERWEKLCQSAAGQCDRAYVPEVRPLRPLAGFLQDPQLPKQRFLAAQGGALQAAPSAGEVLLLVGPEGGFSDAEHLAATAAGFLPLRLGPHVLRTETAALVGAALLLHSV